MLINLVATFRLVQLQNIQSIIHEPCGLFERRVIPITTRWQLRQHPHGAHDERSECNKSLNKGKSDFKCHTLFYFNSNKFFTDVLLITTIKLPNC
jgi:hypothetical protein